jgi:hypothetical protein
LTSFPWDLLLSERGVIMIVELTSVFAKLAVTFAVNVSVHVPEPTGVRTTTDATSASPVIAVSSRDTDIFALDSQ